MADNATTVDEINAILGRIGALREEEISLPADVAMAYSTDRPELLSVAGNRSMTQAEVKAVLDALAGEMKMRRLYQRLDALRCEVMQDIAGSVRAAKDALKYL